MQPNTITRRRRPQPGRVAFTVVLPEPMWRRLKQATVDLGTSMQFLVEAAVRLYFQEHAPTESHQSEVTR